MTLTIVTPPVALPVTVEELKAHLRLEGVPDFDVTLAELVQAATGQIEQRLARALVTRTLLLRLDAFPAVIELPVCPVRSVESIAYLDGSGTSRPLPADAFRVYGLGGEAPSVIKPAAGARWPATADRPDAVSITFVAGMGNPEDVPSEIRAAIRMYAGSLFENREASTPTAMIPVPEGVEDVITAHRGWIF